MLKYWRVLLLVEELQRRHLLQALELFKQRGSKNFFVFFFWDLIRFGWQRPSALLGLVLACAELVGLAQAGSPAAALALAESPPLARLLPGTAADLQV